MTYALEIIGTGFMTVGIATFIIGFVYQPLIVVGIGIVLCSIPLILIGQYLKDR